MIPFIMASLPIFSSIFKWFKIPVLKPVPTSFFINLITQTIHHRIQTGSKRNDIVDLMVDAMKDEGSKESEKNEHDHDQFEKDQKFEHGEKKKEFDEFALI